MFNGIICSLFDARRQNVYAGVYQGWELETVMEERHVSIDDLLSQLHSLNKLVLFIGADVEIFKDKMIEKLGEHAIFAPSTIALPRASKLIAIAETKPLPSIEEVHHFVPQYHRLAQAEANWIQDQKRGNNK